MAVHPKLPSGKSTRNMGQIKGNAQADKFGNPFEDIDGGVGGMHSLKNDIGEKSGFQADTADYIVKKGTQFGEAAKLNIMPPGMDINDQPMRDIRDMPMKTLVAESYPGDGWEPFSRDLEEGYASKGKISGG